MLRKTIIFLIFKVACPLEKYSLKLFICTKLLITDKILFLNLFILFYINDFDCRKLDYNYLQKLIF